MSLALSTSAPIPTEPKVSLPLQLHCVILYEDLRSILYSALHNEFGGYKTIVPRDTNPLQLCLLV